MEDRAHLTSRDAKARQGQALSDELVGKMPTCDATGELVVPAVIECLDQASAMLHDVLDCHHCPSKVQNQIDIVLEELFVNVCSYAYRDVRGPGEVRVSYRCAEGGHGPIVVQVADEGIPFDPTAREDPQRVTTVHEAHIGGLGIFMAKRLTDSLTYRRIGDSNVVTFAKGW